jgi:rhodanese-related sulfurtransferase
MPVVQLNNEELQRLLEKDPGVQLLDVRTPQEYFLLGHIPGSRLLPIYSLPDALPTLNPKLKTVLICEHGVRSADASYYLLQNGFEQVYNLTSGMAEWNGPRVFTSSDGGEGAEALHHQKGIGP